MKMDIFDTVLELSSLSDSFLFVSVIGSDTTCDKNDHDSSHSKIL